MQIKTTLGLIIVALLFICGDQEEDKAQAEKLFGLVIQKHLRHQSVAVSEAYLTKYYDEEGTVRIYGSCQEIRDSGDTLFGGKISFITESMGETIYLGDGAYSFYYDSKTGTDYTSVKDQKWPITGDASRALSSLLFLHPAKLNASLAEADNVSVAKEDFPPLNIWKITLKFPDTEEDSDYVHTYWINVSDSVIIRKSFRNKFQGYYSFDEWNFSGYRFDEVSEARLKERLDSLLTVYKMDQYVPEKREEIFLLANGTKAPYFSGMTYPDEIPYDLEDEKSAIVILDFWYLNCYWCIKAIPDIQRIYQKYRVEGLMVLGINSVDNNERNRKKIPHFLQYNEMSYPVILVDKKVDSLYQVKAYPSLYLMDNTRNIIFSQIGFTKTLGDTLETIIQKQLSLLQTETKQE